MGPSGSGKTSLLRAMAGLWRSGKGKITFYLDPEVDFTQEKSDTQENSGKRGDVLFLPQRPYMVLGSLRQQLLYPTWSATVEETTPGGSNIDGTQFKFVSSNNHFFQLHLSLCKQIIEPKSKSTEEKMR